MENNADGSRVGTRQTGHSSKALENAEVVRPSPKARPDLPYPDAPPPPIQPPEDKDFPGVLDLLVDASDRTRGILDVRETVPVSGAGPLTLIYPEWLPGFHSPQGQIELFAGLQISTSQGELEWRRDPVNVYAFHVDVPLGVNALNIRFQHLSPTDSEQGRVAFSPSILNLQWNTVLVHPAGHYARRVRVRPSLILPPGWKHACALQAAAEDGVLRMEECSLDVLVDSPLYAGAHFKRYPIGKSVHLNVISEDAEKTDVPDARLQELANAVTQTERLFGARHFDRFEFLCCLSEEIGGLGVEHHRSCEIAAKSDLFTEWEKNLPRRSVMCHEFIHSWNGKFRRGSDSWQPCFMEPIRNSLMWVYEGLTQYWSEVLSARSGLVSAEEFRGSLALTAASLELRPGREWRPMRDTTRDPIMAARKPIPWPSWQRSEDYYPEGGLLWLEVDMMLRELSHGARSLEDFARDFFGCDDGVWVTKLYTFDDICAALARCAAWDWRGHLEARLNAKGQEPPMEGIKKAGWALTFKDYPNPFHKSQNELSGLCEHQFSVGFITDQQGEVNEVIWGSPAFASGLRAGDSVVAVHGREFSPDALEAAIRQAMPLRLVIRRFKRLEDVRIDYSGGLRYPHLTSVGPDAFRRVLQPL